MKAKPMHYVLIVLFNENPYIAINLDGDTGLLLTDDLLDKYAEIVDIDRSKLSGYKLNISSVFQGK